MTVSVEQIERSGFAAWSPDETTMIGGWTVASSGGFTRRLNSATTSGSADTSLETREAIRSWLKERDADLTVRITPLVDGDTAAACATGWGLAPVDRTHVLVRESWRPEAVQRVIVVQAGDSVFTQELFRLNGRDQAKLGSWQRIVERIGDRGVGLWIPGVAVGFVAVSHNIGSVFSVAVGPNHRRQGFATQIMDAANAWFGDQGASTLFLQVLGTNTPARRLYERLGFVETYRYHYLQVASGERNAT